jgi:hypothetical protein
MATTPLTAAAASLVFVFAAARSAKVQAGPGLEVFIRNRRLRADLQSGYGSDQE